MSSPTTAAGKIRVVTVVQKFLLQTTGTDNSEVIVELSLPGVADWGPYIESITAHTETEQKTTNFQWKAYTYWGLDGNSWSAATSLFAFQTVAEKKIQADFNDKTRMGLKMRYALVCSPVTGTAREQALVTLALVFQFPT